MIDLDRLRELRNIPERDLGLGAQFDSVRKQLKKRSRSLGAIGTGWAAVVPEELLVGAALVSFSRGVLTVRCDNASAKFNLDRFLRSGGELSLVRACPAGMVKVRLVL